MLIVNIGNVLIIKTRRDIARFFTPLQFTEIRLEDRLLDLLAAFGADWMGDVSTQSQAPAAAVAVRVSIFIESPSAVVAIAGAQVVSLGTRRATVAQFARRHRQEKPVVAVYKLRVANDKDAIKGERAERLQTVSPPGTKANPNFCHMKSPLRSLNSCQVKWCRVFFSLIFPRTLHVIMLTLMDEGVLRRRFAFINFGFIWVFRAANVALATIIATAIAEHRSQNQACEVFKTMNLEFLVSQAAGELRSRAA